MSLSTLAVVGPMVAGTIYFYWRLLDRRLTDVDDRQQWFKTYEGDNIHGDLLNARIGSIRCYPPQSLIGKLRRYLLQDLGRTEVTVIFEKTKIENEVWDELKDLVEDEDTTVQTYNYKPSTGSSFVVVEVSGFDSEEVEEAASRTVMLIDTYLQEQKNNRI